MNINDFDELSSSGRQIVMNNRTYIRNIPSQPLQPYLNTRPVLTKYSIMPIVDPRSEVNTPLIQQSTFNSEQIFNPGNDLGPWSGYASNVNRESELRNQVFALQECSQSIYVPNSKSSLYNVNWKNKQPNLQQPFPDLFKKPELGLKNTNDHPEIIGYALFNNATRQQLKDLTNNPNC